MSFDPTIAAPKAPTPPSADARAAAAAVDEARKQMLAQLWQVALGSAEGGDGDGTLSAPGISMPPGMLSIEALLAAQEQAGNAPTRRYTAPVAPRALDGDLALSTANHGYEDEIAGAAERTGLPAPMLAAIIGAEANSVNGRWDPNSTNPRSSAAGLGQFLASTWETEAERPGSWLNRAAAANGWLDAKGQVDHRFRANLLELRFNPKASIEASADFAKSNLEALKAKGHMGAKATPAEQAKYAYLAHHLGLGDAQKFLSGGLTPERARMLLSAQIGVDAASGRIAQAGDAAAAHRQWLVSYIDGKIDLGKYEARPKAV